MHRRIFTFVMKLGGCWGVNPRFLRLLQPLLYCDMSVENATAGTILKSENSATVAGVIAYQPFTSFIIIIFWIYCLRRKDSVTG